MLKQVPQTTTCIGNNETQLQKLKRRKNEVEKQLVSINRGIEILESNPEINELLNVLANCGY